VLAREGGQIVLAESDRALVATFHPELTDDDRLHRRFVEKVRSRRNTRTAREAGC
jgi:5'-phosphate synthase pdxT subunit